MKLLCFLSFLIIAVSSCNRYGSTEKVEFSSKWKFKVGDHHDYSKENYDDSKWDYISTNDYWENQNYPDVDGYSWYRNKIFISSKFKKAIHSDSVKFYLGPIDDSDKVYLNGMPLGQNNKNFNGFNLVLSLEDEIIIPDSLRKYILSVNDRRIKWDDYNTIAVQVFDRGGNGGIHTAVPPYFSATSLDDSIRYNKSSFYKFSNTGLIDTTLIIENCSSGLIKGTLYVIMNNRVNGKEVHRSKIKVELKSNQVLKEPVSLPAFLDPVTITFLIKDKFSKKNIEDKTGLNYILPR